jgi:hypothetical protein
LRPVNEGNQPSLKKGRTTIGALIENPVRMEPVEFERPPLQLANDMLAPISFLDSARSSSLGCPSDGARDAAVIDG